LLYIYKIEINNRKEKNMEIDKQNMPKHIAIIMDGNRRWARAQGKPASFGHKAGAKTLENIVRYANKIGLEYITVYAFSTENFKRSKEEVDYLMNLFIEMFNKKFTKLKEKGIKVVFSGSKDGLREDVISSMNNIVKETQNT